MRVFGYTLDYVYGNGKGIGEHSPGVTGSMIIGIGTDLVHVPRLSRIVERWGERFLNRIFCEEEIAYCFRYKYPSHSFASRFAAKEACSKALGTGMSRGVTWRQMCVLNRQAGQPVLRLSGVAMQRAAELGGRRWHLSLTHDHEYAHAVVILED